MTRTPATSTITMGKPVWQDDTERQSKEQWARAAEQRDIGVSDRAVVEAVQTAGARPSTAWEFATAKRALANATMVFATMKRQEGESCTVLARAAWQPESELKPQGNPVYTARARQYGIGICNREATRRGILHHCCESGTATSDQVQLAGACPRHRGSRRCEEEIERHTRAGAKHEHLQFAPWM